MIFGILCLMSGCLISIYLPSTMTFKAAEIARESINEYLKSMNVKYKNEKIRFVLKSSMFSTTKRMTLQGWWNRVDWIIEIKSDEDIDIDIPVSSGQSIDVVINNKDFCSKCNNPVIGLDICGNCRNKVA